MTPDLSSLQKELQSLERAVRICGEKMAAGNVPAEELELFRAGVIQNFEFTYELYWKFIQRWIRENRTPEDADHPRSRRELFRLAARFGLIADPLPWFDYGEKRNLTAHTYDERTAALVYTTAVKFLPDAAFLCRRLEAGND